MTFLINKPTLDALGIDTLERGIVLSLLLLRQACTSAGKDSPYYQAIRISTNVRAAGETYAANINATAKIPYQSSAALVSGMNLLKYLKPLSTLRVDPFFAPISPTPDAPALPQLPNLVNTLEKYLFFYSQVLAASVLPIVDRIKISFLEEDPKEPSLLIDYLLPIDWDKYLLTNNLIGATKLLASLYIDVPPLPDEEEEITNVLISNQGLIGNLTFIGN